mmetsp:Transcript_54634/g.157098  ORF Transcript_54634/g.157098 Transcript_54634/m.157098 type:complete len:366 (+) Transcript_54634:56-1153(+)
MLASGRSCGDALATASAAAVCTHNILRRWLPEATRLPACRGAAGSPGLFGRRLRGPPSTQRQLGMDTGAPAAAEARRRRTARRGRCQSRSCSMAAGGHGPEAVEAVEAAEAIEVLLERRAPRDQRRRHLASGIGAIALALAASTPAAARAPIERYRDRRAIDATACSWRPGSGCSPPNGGAATERRSSASRCFNTPHERVDHPVDEAALGPRGLVQQQRGVRGHGACQGDASDDDSAHAVGQPFQGHLQDRSLPDLPDSPTDASASAASGSALHLRRGEPARRQDAVPELENGLPQVLNSRHPHLQGAYADVAARSQPQAQTRPQEVGHAGREGQSVIEVPRASLLVLLALAAHAAGRPAGPILA